jgi:uncharacterized protein (DUF1330 family)
MPFLEPTEESFTALLSRNLEGPVLMLNLLRFRDVADYSDSPELAPDADISGEEAYRRYLAHTEPFLVESGGSLSVLGEGGNYLIGPQDERWDLMMLVKQESVASFAAFVSQEGYQAGVGHRTAALEDSRILPLVELPDGL